MTAQHIVSLKNVRREYIQGGHKINALDGLDISIDSGELVAIVGPSGSGKTTALNMIGCLDVPTAGEVLVEGKDVGHLSKSELSNIRRDRIGFVFQSYNLIPVLTALENVEFVMDLQGTSADERRKCALDTLKEVGLEGYENRLPKQLSGGQQQRVAIARAVASQPAIVLADEPTANLDSKTAESLLDMMEKLNKDKGITFLFSTHDQKVMNRARRILLMVDGKLESDSSSERK